MVVYARSNFLVVDLLLKTLLIDSVVRKELRTPISVPEISICGPRRLNIQIVCSTIIFLRIYITYKRAICSNLFQEKNMMLHSSSCYSRIITTSATKFVARIPFAQSFVCRSSHLLHCDHLDITSFLPATDIPTSYCKKREHSGVGLSVLLFY